MKFTLAAALTALVATASVHAQNCNPSYNATSAGSCIDGCNEVMKVNSQLMIYALLTMYIESRKGAIQRLDQRPFIA